MGGMLGAEAMEDIACCPVGDCKPVGLQCWSQAGRVVLDLPTVGQGRFRVTRLPCPVTGHIPLVGHLFTN